MIWLEGRWEKESEGLKTVEIWERQKNKTYQVKGFMLEGQDTIFSEAISVKPGKTGIEYVVVIADQNNGQPVPFKLTANTDSKAVFENPEHDFPKIISYTKTSPDSVKVEIKGSIKGKPALETYMLKKQ